MILFPEVQRKAHEELDRVVGKDRFPEFTDQNSLPYMTAVCQEVRVREHPVLPYSRDIQLLGSTVENTASTWYARV